MYGVDMQENSKNLLDIRGLFDPFREHLEVETNTRILFSGKFGSGKTYFLKKFFKEHQEKYFCIHLHPTNYQIATNEKIMEYIKTDLMLKLFENIPVPGSDGRQKIRSKKKRSRSRLENIREQRWYQVALSVGTAIPILDRFTAAIDGVVKAGGSITEDDIKKKLGTLEGKKKILIIDDLDRTDPMHIFRILNVFSSFVGEEDEDTESDKLGFDKIICVCDIDNLRNIFSHVYGQKTDFGGYVDKYYSNNVYRHDDNATRQTILRQIDKIVDSFNMDELIKKRDPSSYYKYLIYKTLQLGFRLKKNRPPNLRILFKAVNHELPALTSMQHNPTNTNRITMDASNRDQVTMLNKSISALKAIFGDKKVLLECVKSIISENEHESAEDFETENANSAFAGLIFSVLVKKKLLDCEPDTPTGFEEREKRYTLSLGGREFRLKLREERGHTHLIVSILKDEFGASAKLLYMLLSVYLENDLEEKM